MDNKHYRTLSFYLDNKLAGTFVYEGNGKYINVAKKIRIAISKEFIDGLISQEDKYLKALTDIENLKDYVTEDDIKLAIKGVRFGVSQKYPYPYDKVSSQVFKTVMRNNNLMPIEILKEEGVLL